jgi:ribosomal protein S18 acetylase RimI-like enzyme
VTPVERLAPDGVDALAAVLAAWNADPAAHVVYVDTAPGDVAHAIRNLEPHGPPGVLLIRAGDRLRGALAVEADPEIGRAWLWGPFTDPAADAAEARGLEDALLAATGDLLPVGVGELEIAGDERNERLVAFADRHGFVRFSRSFLLAFPRERFDPAAVAPLPDLDPALDGQMAALHEAAFAGSHWNARQMREMHGTHRRLLGFVEDGRLLGYVFVRVEAEVDEAEVEFLAVDPAARGKGVGGALLRAALHHIFSFDHVTGTGLSVREELADAIHLYRKTGFEVERVALGWRRPASLPG